MAGYMPAPGGSAVSRFLGGGIPAGAAVGRAAQNPTYLGGRLKFEKHPEGSLDPLSSTRYLICLVRQAAIFGALWAALYIIWGTVGFVLYLLTNGSGFVTAVGEIGSILLWWAFVIAFLLIPVPAQVSEWKFFVDDKGAARPVVFEHVTYAFRRRNTPVDGIGVRRLSLPGGVTRDYLEITRGAFVGYISCFEEGRDLYVGWTYWIRMAPWRYFLLRLERIWHQLSQKADEMHVTLRYESAKSLREAMHNAAREGIDVAVGQMEAEGQGIVATLPVSSNSLDR